MRPATAQDWQHQPLPAARQPLPFQRQFTAAEMAQLQLGLVPVEMEDKWFIFWQDAALHFHRSWTGFAVYLMEFQLAEADGSGQVQACWVNRDPAQYGSTDAAGDQDLLVFLIDALLLNRPVPFPVPPEIPADQAAILQHHQVGYGRSNQEPR